jgi:hypothetical protein
MKQNVGTPHIVGGIVLLLVILGVLYKVFLGGGTQGPATAPEGGPGAPPPIGVPGGPGVPPGPGTPPVNPGDMPAPGGAGGTGGTGGTGAPSGAPPGPAPSR